MSQEEEKERTSALADLSSSTTGSGRHWKGSCLCGKIRYRVKSLASTKMAHCHCTDCRKFHGSAFSTFGETTTLEWIDRDEARKHLQTYVATNGSKRQFCRNCGSSLTFASSNADPGYIEFALATLDEASDGSTVVEPDAHVFVDSKVPWLNIDNDGLPKHARGRA
ncbi:Glutathione-dependent formaldehyde-activating enzyme [Seminavis robusta]|uniref:Glutathione-dependent formaldehyde-activating enzyme n=1 Tax=Seminavis robusta TaxID=568900 RepID=A0A9N8EUA1_9STRA|nr:Glutathione-dependent formaldehyde-activating enzyme [Seminavis robusta]|eukprot:Sro1984_g309310.1 Glutathione-dependent formaldehyde-activating enzyme (166) ;mRNA; f:4752-5249